MGKPIALGTHHSSALGNTVTGEDERRQPRRDGHLVGVLESQLHDGRIVLAQAIRVAESHTRAVDATCFDEKNV